MHALEECVSTKNTGIAHTKANIYVKRIKKYNYFQNVVKIR